MNNDVTTLVIRGRGLAKFNPTNKRKFDAELIEQICTALETNEQRLVLAREALQGAQVVMEAYLTEASNNDNYCRVVDALSQLDGVAAEMRHADEPEEGTWAWALEQMKAGKRVWYEAQSTNEWEVRYVRLRAVALMQPSADKCFINEWGGLWFPKLSEIERTDWQIVDATERAEEAGE